MTDSWLPVHIPSTPNYVFNLPITWDLAQSAVCYIRIPLASFLNLSFSRQPAQQVYCTSSGDCFCGRQLMQKAADYPSGVSDPFYAWISS